MLQEIINHVFFVIFKLNPELKIVNTLNFFIYDSIKILLLLLFMMITIIGFIRSYISQDTIKKKLSKHKYGLGNIFAAMLGAITPFCSCSSIPLFLSFLRAGVPLGISMSFLITSPIVNEYLVIIMLATFGWKITLVYIILGIIIGVLSGIIIGKLKLEKYIVNDIKNSSTIKEETFKNIKERINYGLKESKNITKKLWYWILLGVSIGAIIHNYVPSEFIQKIIESTGIFSVPLAVIIGVPMYGNSAGIVPIALALFEKGIPLGTTLAFMMAITALSFPEAIILRRAIKLTSSHTLKGGDSVVWF
ncbi:permease [Candidatus Woesearchaeota archaeon]|nr:permease [Candidatus Woesearchaeota archaeon]MCF7901283.1 permease [Candidatus Woesearchaeota archaeon]MCF8013776.1 permease [Candidatus Woesearchaeota archaeon]